MSKPIKQPPYAYVQERLSHLIPLKNHKLPIYTQIKNDYKQYKEELYEDKKGDYTRFRMNTGFAITNSKVSDILSATPSYDFIALDDNARKYRKIVERFWNWLWTTSKTDNEIYKIVMDACKYGTGWGLERIVDERRTIKVPKLDKEKGIVYEDKEITDYSGCKLEYIPWENIFINGRDLNSSTQCIIIKNYNRDEFFNKFGKNPLLTGVTEDNIPYGKQYVYPTTTSSYGSNGTLPATTLESPNPDDNFIVTLVLFIDKAADEYIMLANKQWINPVKGTEQVAPLPFPHKELPIVGFTDHYLEDDIWGLGEFEVSKDTRDLKDETRSLMLEAIKVQAGLITIDPEADFDEGLLQLGPRSFARVNKEDIGFFAPNINVNSLQYLESKLDEDIIIETGVDFRSQVVAQNETATKTEARKQSAQKRINLCMKYNARTFFERLARLRLSNMQFWYDGPTTITTKGEQISSTKSGGLKIEPLNGGYGTFTVRPEFIKGEFQIIPNMESLMGDSTERQKQRFLEFVQLVGAWIDPATGKPIVDPKKLIEAGRGIIDDAVDIDLLLQSSEEVKSPESLLREAEGLPEQPINPEASGGFIPPSQRSGKPVLLPSSPKLEG